MTVVPCVRLEAFSDLEVVAEIGRGAETIVYRVRRHGEDYALKVLTRIQADPEAALTAVRREAALLGCVGHPLLPRIFEVGQVDGRPYLILEFIDGSALSASLRAGPLDEETALRLAIDVVGPLAAAHRAGLVHRDIKPDNIIVGPRGDARLIDFGMVARGGVRNDLVLAGTLLYGAPEQTGMLKRPVDGRTDLYALGVLLFECVTGQTPYRSPDAGELIRLHATAPVPDPRSIRPELSPTLAAVIGKLMAKDPDDRYQSGECLLADLRRLSAQPRAVFEVGTGRGLRPAVPTLLVSRENEVTELATRWLSARDGRGGVALVEGLAGVGKSRLVRELTTAAATDGDLVLYGKCVPDDPVPLAPLRTAIERYLRTVDQLPSADRDLAVARLRSAAGQGGPLLRALSPMLARLVQAPDLGETDRHEQFSNAVAAFLVDLGREWDGAVLHLDDVQWLDGATRRALQQVATLLPEAPLLVIATGRDDEENVPALARFRADMGASLDTRLSLGPLDDDAVGALIALHLGGLELPRTMLDELVARVGGNPFTVVEYLRAVIDAGLISPSWDGWHLDLAGLDRLELSDDAFDLVLQRIDGLGGETRRLLAAAAATGRRFHADLVAKVSDINPRQGRAALAEAEARRLVATVGGGGYTFLHDRVREALLAGLAPAVLRGLHQRIAEVLESIALLDLRRPEVQAPGKFSMVDPRYVYATARHYALGEADRTPEKVYATGWAAGRLALAEHAPAEALTFLEMAAAAARTANLEMASGFHLLLGVSCARTGRFAEALDHLDRALRAEPDPLRRAAVHTQIAWVYVSAWDPGRAFDSACRGFAELGRPLPRGRFALVRTTLASFVTGLAIGITRIGFGRARAETRERDRLEAALYEVGGYASTMRMHLRMRAIMSFRSLYVVNRLGPGTEYVRAMAGFGVSAEVGGLHRLSRRIFARAAKVATGIGDPVLAAHVEWERGAALYVSGGDDGQAWTRALTEHERWLELGDYLTGVAGICVHLLQVGRTREAQAWYERGRARLGVVAEAEGAAFAAIAVVIPAQFGRPDQAASGIETLRRYLTLNADNRSQVINLFLTRIIALVEQDELGEPFDQVTAEFAATGLKPRALLLGQRPYFVYQALGRLGQCHRAPREQRVAYRHAAERAVAQLRRATGNSTLRAYYRVARADLAVLTGRPRTALRDLVRAEDEVLHLDAPLIGYEVARVRARALRTLGNPALALQQARYALMIAAEQQWAYRIRWVCDEFGLTDQFADLFAVRAAAPTTLVDDSDDSGALHRRRLTALQQVSLAAATVLDPRELARVVLDETVRILGAERSYLFLVDPDLDQLVPHLGRDGDGHDIDRLTGYSSTLVDRVRHSRKALVVTGSEEGMALGSRSAQIHGLRSIMIAPLLFDSRLLGVVYLDSRVAKGMFTTDDVDILMAITNHVAVSLETARAAQLEVAVQAARRQRDVAETLRAAMAEQSATLDPDEVMHRLLRALARTLGGNAAALLTRDNDRYVVAVSYGPAAVTGTRLDSAVAVLTDLAGPLVATAATGAQPPFGVLLGSPRNWLAIPVASRGEPFGVVLVAAGDADATWDAQVEVAAALAGQGMTAYENARLFSQVRRLATIDGLTGLNNRNHFFAEADKQLQIAQRYRRPVAAIMVDVDHFKRINDSFGHPVGDEVIRVIGARLRAAARECDVLGRYGGEEFALLVPETGASATVLAERLRQIVCAEPVSTTVGPLEVTISVGMAYVDSGGHHLGQLLAQADAALYEAKQNGRNRVAAAALR